MSFRAEFIALLAVGSLILAAGCSSNDLTNPQSISFPAKNVSYSNQVAPYFALSCNATGCHDGSAYTAGGFDLTSWSAIRGRTYPGDTNAYIVLVMFGKIAHSGQFYANDNQRNGIKQWVIEGVKDN